MKNQPYILVVDDDQQVARLLKKTLERDGYFVIATTSGKKALATIEERLPGLLILDLNMPEPHGLDILRIARSRFPYLRTLVISGYLKGEQLDAAGFLGAAATLEKPFAPEALATRVREVLGG